MFSLLNLGCTTAAINPEESIKITRQYCPRGIVIVYRGYTAIIATDLHITLDAPVDKLARNYRILSRTVTAPTPLFLVCSAVAQIPLVPCWLANNTRGSRW